MASADFSFQPKVWNYINGGKREDVDYGHLEGLEVRLEILKEQIFAPLHQCQVYGQEEG